MNSDFTTAVMRAVARDNTPNVQRALKEAATNRVNQIIVDAAKTMKAEFEKDEVTQEIDGGITASNSSGTLSGGEGKPYENLTSFIGFYEGTRPTDEIRKRLDPTNEDGPRIIKTEKVNNGNVPTYRLTVRAVDIEALHDATPLPWGEKGGPSWAEGIEKGIPGFAQFLNKATSSPKPSHSGGGIQVERTVRNAEYAPPSNGYLSRIFNNFLKSISAPSYRQRNR